MKLLIIDNTEPSDAPYTAPLIQVTSELSAVQVIGYKEASRVSLASYKGIILSGVPKSYSYATINSRLPYLRWLKNTELPILGICLGHQNIGRLFDASVIKNVEAEEGIYTLELLQDDPLFKGLPTNIEITTTHRGSISLPREFKQLASTRTCKNQVMKHSSKDIYGLQFHPEFSAAGIQLLRNFVEITDKLGTIKEPSATGLLALA